MTLTLMEVVARPSAVLLAGFAIRALLFRRSAAERHAVLAASLFAALAVIPLTSIAPGMTVTLPDAVVTGSASQVAAGPAPRVASTVVVDDPPGTTPLSQPSLAAIWISAVSYTHLTLPTNREV